MVSTKPVVHIDAVEPLAYGLVQQHRHDGGIHAAGKAEHHLVVADPALQGLDGRLHPVAEVPALLRAADLEHEVGQYLRAILRMHNFRVELERVHPPVVVEHRGERAGCGYRPPLEVGRYRLDPVSMAHPHSNRTRDFAEQRIAGHDLYRHLPVFSLDSGHDLAAELLAHELHSVADAENGNAKAEYPRIHARRTILEHAVWPAGQYHSKRRILAQPLGGGGAAYYLRIDRHLPNPPCDQLRVLRPVVQYSDPLPAICRNLLFHVIRPFKKKTIRLRTCPGGLL